MTTKPKAPGSQPDAKPTALEFLRSVYQDPKAPRAERLRAAVTVAQYEAPRLRDGGKKEVSKKKARTAGKGQYARSVVPKDDGLVDELH